VYARSTSLSAPASAIETGITYVNDQLMPVLTRMDGCIGLSMLVDRSRGECITTSAWDSLEAMRASAGAVRPLRDEFVAALGAAPPRVEEWEVALMHRDHPSTMGACARVSWLQGDPRSIDGSIEAFRSALPIIEGLPGFCSASLLVDRETGGAVSTVTYDSADTLTQTRAAANSLRTDVAQQANAEVIEVSEFELAVAHLRVPELV